MPAGRFAEPTERSWCSRLRTCASCPDGTGTPLKPARPIPLRLISRSACPKARAASPSHRFSMRRNWTGAPLECPAIGRDWSPHRADAATWNSRDMPDRLAFELRRGAACCREADAARLLVGRCQMWTPPLGKGFGERFCKAAGCGHMSGRIVRLRNGLRSGVDGVQDDPAWEIAARLDEHQSMLPRRHRRGEACPKREWGWVVPE